MTLGNQELAGNTMLPTPCSVVQLRQNLHYWISRNRSKSTEVLQDHHKCGP